MKLAVIGGGSTYTPELVDGIARLTADIKITELVLVDPDAERLSVVGPFSARIMARYGHPAVVRWTSDLDAGVDGAGGVLLQLRVGGQATRQRDETWPLEFCCVGQETTGAGGFAKALRTVPVVLDIAERARRADRRPHRAAGRGHRGGRRGAVLLPAVLLGARRGRRGGARQADQGGGRRRHRAAVAADVPGPGPGYQAGP